MLYRDENFRYSLVRAKLFIKNSNSVFKHSRSKAINASEDCYLLPPAYSPSAALAQRIYVQHDVKTRNVNEQKLNKVLVTT